MFSNSAGSILRAGSLGAAAAYGAVWLSLLPSHGYRRQHPFASASNCNVDESSSSRNIHRDDTSKAFGEQQKGMETDRSTLTHVVDRLLLVLPHRALSAACATMAAFPIPSPVRPFVYRAYTSDADDAEWPLRHYSSMAAFFARKVKPELRPVHPDAPLVAPVDATLIAAAPLGPRGDLPATVKGTNYSLRELIAAQNHEPIVQTNHAPLYAALFHIPPTNSHAFFSPTEWSLSRSKRIPGHLYWLHRYPQATTPYTSNERLSMIGTWSHGFFSLTAIGACGIGSIVLDNDSNLQSNTMSTVTRGQSIGHFRMGSAIVLVFEAPPDFHFSVQNGQTVKVGEPLGYFTSQSSQQATKSHLRTSDTARHNSQQSSSPSTPYGMRARRSW